jgi:DNA-binding MarR family transcriptional regulator
MPAGRLAELTGLTTGAVTTLIDRLEDAGLASREPDPADRRRVIVRSLAPPPEVARLVERYPDDDLALILGFLRDATALAAAQVAALRGKTFTPGAGSDEPDRGD